MIKRSREKSPQQADHDAAPPRRDRTDTLIICALGAALLLAVWAPQARGVFPFTFDEVFYKWKTDAYAKWLADGARHAVRGKPLWLFSQEALAQAEAFEDMHPGLVKLAGILPRWFFRAALGREDGYRVTGGLFLALAGAALYWFLRPRVGRAYALVGAVGLVSLPRIFAHGHFHALDVPIMAMVLVASLAFYRAAWLNRWGPALGAGALIGLAAATKLNALALAPHLGLWLLAERPPGWKKALAGVLVAPPIFFALWPWLWHDTAGQLARYWEFHSAHHSVPVTFLGTVYGWDTTAPFFYPLLMMAVTLPVMWLFGALGGIGAAASGKLGREGTFLLLGLVINLWLLSLPNATRYGGVRLFLPAFPFAVALAVMAAHRLGTSVAADRAGRRTAALVLGIILLVPNVVGCVAYHPYLLSYFNEAVGLRSADHMGMDVTYWGDSYAAAREFMNRPENARAVYHVDFYLGANLLDEAAAVGAIPADVQINGRGRDTEIAPDTDWVIVSNHPPLRQKPVRDWIRTRTPVEEWRFHGVPLLWMYEGPARIPHARDEQEAHEPQ